MAAFLAAWVALAIAPWDRPTWLLENFATVLVLVPTIAYRRRLGLSDRAWLQGLAFALLHTIGSHYTYSHVPLGDWARDAFGSSRNHYDRVVHWSFGALVFATLRELAFRRVPARAPRFGQLAVTVGLVLGISAAYEIVEWLTALVADPDAGIAFLGTQGDDWDAQKDMACAFAGSIVGAALEWRFARRAARSDER